MKNLTLIFAFIIGTSFALSAQRGGLNSNPNVSSNSSIKNGKINNNPNVRTNTSNRNGSSYGRNGSTRPGSNGNQAGRGGNRGGGHYGNGHGHNNHHGHNNGHGHHNHNNGHGHHNHHNGHGHHNHHGHGYVNTNHHHGHHYNGYCNYSNHNFGWRPVCTSVYNTGCNTIWACGFDSDRLRAAKRFVRNNYVNSHQIAHIMSAFSFESSRLAFAKYAFNRTCDVQNYGQVFAQLTFNSSRRELDCFIQNYYW